MKLYAAVAAVLFLAVGAVTYAILDGDGGSRTSAEAIGTSDDGGSFTSTESLGQDAPSGDGPDDDPLNEGRLLPVSPTSSAAPGVPTTADGDPAPDGGASSQAANDADQSGYPTGSSPGSPNADGSPGPSGTPSGSGTPTGGTTPSGSTIPGAPRPAPNPGGTPGPRPAASVFESLRNDKAEFSRYADVPSAQLPFDQLTAGGYGAPTPNPISGQFRMHCEYSHFAYDDPIVFPGSPGSSHLHMFFGNTETNSNSDSNSLFDRGGGSCNGYELDRSAYWVPALLQNDTHTIVPTEILLYFKTNSPGSVQAFPKGLRVIAGASPNDPDGANRYRWKCENSIGRPAGTFEPINDGPFFDTIPDCRALGYETLGFMLDFPMCWDGKNLDSADHRSHMSYSCGASHPVVFPQLQYIIHYPAPASNRGVHLSSDSLECQTGAINRCGDTLHGDWWNAWHERTNQTWINECSRKRVVCQVPSISASIRLQGPPLFGGNPVLSLPSGSYVPGRD